jgi:hypothetical protein
MTCRSRKVAMLWAVDGSSASGLEETLEKAEEAFKATLEKPT